MIFVEEKRLLIISAAVCAAASGIIAFLNPVGGVICAVSGAAMIFLFRYYNKKRCSDLVKLNDYLARVCSGDYGMDVADNAEGELSILKNNLYKVIVMLRTSNEALAKDKVYLADSLADISHQLKTPLTSITVMTDLMKTEENGEKRAEFIGIAETQLEKMKWLITTLLKISKLDADTVKLDSSMVSINDVISDSLKPFMIMLDLKNIDVERETEDFLFRGDRSWTAEAVGNIVKNCIEHTENGGISFSVSETGLYGELIISDNGSGIDPEDMPHIFERFYHGKNSSCESAGIGLALAREILKKQKATVEALSAPGAGTTFIIRFYKSAV